jgi:hypothetical protein
MTPERWQQINELYHNALELDASGQGTFLNQACAGDAELRDEVESLIASHDQAGSFISEPALKVAAKGLAEDQATTLAGRSFSHYRIESILGVGGGKFIWPKMPASTAGRNKPSGTHSPMMPSDCAASNERRAPPQPEPPEHSYHL